MGKNKRLITKIRNVWRKQEELERENHKKISLMLKDFCYKDLKDILAEKEIQDELFELLNKINYGGKSK